MKVRNYGTDIRYGYACIDRCLNILQEWEDGIDSRELLQRVLENSANHELTARTQEHIVRELFKHRFMTEEGLPWSRVLKLCDDSFSYDVKTQAIFLLTARADAMISDFLTMVYWPAVKKGEMVMPPDVAKAFIEEAASEGRGGSVWSDARKLRLTRGLHSTLCEFGLISREGNPKFRLNPTVMHSAIALLLAYELHDRGLNDQAVVAHPDWALFGLTPNEVIGLLRGSQFTNSLLLQSSGDLVEISWRDGSMLEVAQSYVR